MKVAPSFIKLAAVVMLSYFVVYYFLAVMLDFTFMQSDVLGYWQDATNWRQPFHAYHVPGYPFLIALFRGVAGHVIQPVHLMQLIVIGACLLSIFFVYSILGEVTKNRNFAELGGLVFGLYPLIGITYVVYPLSDLVAIMLFLGGVWFMLKRKPLAGAAFWGLAMITHKAIWPFVAKATFMQLIMNGKNYLKQPYRTLGWIGILLLPIVLLWFLGTEYHGSPWWIIQSNLETEVSSKSTLPLLDGVIGTFLVGGVKNYVKSGIGLIVVLASGGLAYLAVKQKGEGMLEIGLPIAVSVFILILTINQYEIWAAVRYSRLLVVPAILFLASHLWSTRIVNTFNRKPVYWGSIVGLVISNLIYAWYMARVFFS